MREALAWIERGLAAAAPPLANRRPDPAAVRELSALLPPVSGLARLWGGLEPARAAGFAAAVGSPLLRGACRAAVAEFAPWPPPTLAGLLARAARDAADPAWVAACDLGLVADLWDQLAVAWARRLPHRLAALGRQRPAPLPAGGALWREAALAAAARRGWGPAPAEQPAGGPRAWRRQAAWALTAAGRARACWALAGAACAGWSPPAGA